jgi:hypothetical protein
MTIHLQRRPRPGSPRVGPLRATLVALLIGSACVSAPLALAAARVRRIQPEATLRCTLLGSVEGAHANGLSVADNEAGALDQIRGRVAALGGNSFAVTNVSSGMWRSVVQADAYVCPDWEPVPGLPPG